MSVSFVDEDNIQAAKDLIAKMDDGYLVLWYFLAKAEVEKRGL